MSKFKLEPWSRYDKHLVVTGFGLRLLVDFDDVDTVDTHRRALALIDHLNANPPKDPPRIPELESEDDTTRDAARDAYWKTAKAPRSNT